MKRIRPKDPVSSQLRCIVTEDVFVEPWKRCVAQESGEDTVDELDIGDISEFHFDQGGIVHKDEPKMSVVLDGVTFSVFLRHTDGLVDGLRRVRRSRSHPDVLSEHVLVRGWIWSLLVTPETGRRLANLLEREIGAKADEIDKAWGKYDADMASMNQDKLRVLSRKRSG